MNLKIHLFAEWPVHADGIMIPIQASNVSIDDLMVMLESVYKIKVKKAQLKGRDGFLDEQHRFFLYKHINGPVELGDFMDEIGADEGAMTAMLRSLQ